VHDVDERAGSWPEGAPNDGVTLTLLAGRDTWTPGDAPIQCAVVINRVARGLDAQSLLSVHGLTYYRLEITDPAGHTFEVPQAAALPSSVSPHFRFAELSTGRSIGERLDWDPAGAVVRRAVDFDDFVVAAGPPATSAGRYRMRAIYEVDEQAESRFAYGVSAFRLVSNEVAVEIKAAPREMSHATARDR